MGGILDLFGGRRLIRGGCMLIGVLRGFAGRLSLLGSLRLKKRMLRACGSGGDVFSIVFHI